MEADGAELAHGEGEAGAKPTAGIFPPIAASAGSDNRQYSGTRNFLAHGQARKSGATISDGVASLVCRDCTQIDVNRLEVGIGYAVIGWP